MTLALVTGASSGIGEALCRLFAQKGISLLITARNLARLEQLKEELPVSVEIVQADLTEQAGRRRLIECLRESSPDLIINNAGFGLYGFAEELELESQLRMIRLNVSALVELTLEGVRAFREAGKEGTIVNVSSAAAFHAFPLLSVYAATKAFVSSFSEALDEEQRRQKNGIRILTSCPGQVATDFARTASKGRYRQKADRSGVMTPEFAASEIYRQIEKKERVRIFSLRYRLFAFLMRRLLPDRLLLSLLFRKMHKRI